MDVLHSENSQNFLWADLETFCVAMHITTCWLGEHWNSFCKVTVFTRGRTARPRRTLLLVKRLIRFPLDIAGAVSVRLDRSAAGRPPTLAAAGGCCHANHRLFSPSDMWKVTKRPLESYALGNCHFGAVGDRLTLRVYLPAPEWLFYDTLLLHSEMTSEIRPGFLWPWVGVTVWIS